jgi:hypothetical protein
MYRPRQRTMGLQASTRVASTIKVYAGHDVVLFGLNSQGTESSARTFSNAFTDRRCINGETSSAPDSHPIQAEFDSRLRPAEETTVSKVGSIGDKSWVEEDGAFIDDRAINVPAFSFSQDLSSESRDWSSTNLDVLDLQELSFRLFSLQPALLRQGGPNHRARRSPRADHIQTGSGRESMESERAST